MISIGNVAYCLGMSSKKLHRWYQEVLSGYREALSSGKIGGSDLRIRQDGIEKVIKVPISRPEHIGERMAIDEKTIDGSCYTILSNRDTNKIALMAKTLKTRQLAKLLKDSEKNIRVKSITRDMAINYEWLGRTVFMKAYHVIDKFHVIKQGLDALQDLRIRYRQEELTKRRKARKAKQEYEEKLHSNGDTTLQLLARSRGLLFKNKKAWTDHQAARAASLFKEYPQIKQGYQLVNKLRQWYKPPGTKRTYQITRTKKIDQLQQIIRAYKLSAIEEIKNLAYLLSRHTVQICNYFKYKETNAKAEALNRNIQRFINVNYGARNADFFFFRLAKLFS